MNNWLSLTPEQVNAIKLQVSSFDEEEIQYRGEVKRKNNSFDHAFGTKYEYDWFVTYLEVKLGNEWVAIIEDGEYGDSLIPFEQDQIEKIIDRLKE